MISRRNYPLLLASQFLSAFGDNAILAVIVGQLTYLQRSGAISEAQLRSTNTLYTSLLFIPYVLLAPFAGYFNDRFSKVKGLIGGNLLKVLGTLLCIQGIRHGFGWQGAGYLVVGIGACLYSPGKYGILPEILPSERLVKANGTVELLTLVAILTGAIGGSVLADVFKDRVMLSFLIVATIYMGALLLNLVMTPTRSMPEVRFAASTGAFLSHVRDLFTTGRLGKLLIGTAMFWVCGATMKINFQPWGLDVLHLPDNTQIALLGLWLSVGVMIGSVLAGQLHRVGDLSKTRLYGFLLAGFLALLFWVHPDGFWTSHAIHTDRAVLYPFVIALLVATGVVAGLFLIPLNAALQAESDPDKLGKTIAAQNLTDNLGMCLAGAYVFGAVRVGLTSSGVFLALGAAVALGCIWMSFNRPAGDRS
ncbi:lysophospholipid transporter LplT [mine drainage metagenome]|uniref:Lysophospholipid transporter LplT n=1 Tax=mine drainage metagenome TaxID=410659 RepID=A0A1J5SBX7_9ZZZZ